MLSVGLTMLTVECLGTQNVSFLSRKIRNRNIKTARLLIFQLKKVPDCINSVAEIKHLQVFEKLLKLRKIQTSWGFALHKCTCIKLMS